MKTIGIIGGFSPEATALFYTKLTALARAGKASTLPHIIVWNVPVPIELERNLLLHGKGLREILPLIVAAAQGLERAGADIVVLPCNTLHTLSLDIQKNISVPFIDIVDVSISALRRLGLRKAGLLGSIITFRSELFTRREGIKFTIPASEMQQKLTNAIHESVSTDSSQLLRSLLRDNLQSFRTHGVKDVLLACTDFSDICPNIAGVRVHDTLSLLATAVMKYKFNTDFRRGVLS